MDDVEYSKDSQTSKNLIKPYISNWYHDNVKYWTKDYTILIFQKQQQQSALKCGILPPKNIWTHSQIYVAFSRCGNPNNIYVWAEQSQFETYNLSKQKKNVKDVVYNEVIKDITSE